MKSIPYGHQWIDKRDIRAIDTVLRGDWLTQGPSIKKFEEALCKYTGARYAVAVSNGTAALHLACLSAGVYSGDEVITSPITFLASANCALYCGARPVFADVDPTTANIIPESIQRQISVNTKAIIPVHFAGCSCDMKAVNSIAKKNKLVVIEDACHALGASYAGNRVGACRYSDMAVFSFHPVKSITTGEGGAVMTNNMALYKKLLCLRNHGVVKDGLKNSHGGWYYEMQLLGYNYRITDIQSALGISQLKKVESFIKRRRKIAQAYNKAFLNNMYFDIPKEKEYAYSSYHLYPLRLKNKFIHRKRKIFNELRKQGLGVQVHYIPVYMQPYYSGLGFKKGLCPNAEDFYRREISIPIFPGIKDSDVNMVIRKIYGVFEKL